MKWNIIVAFSIFSILHFGELFKIDVYKCVTPFGSRGFCRLQSDCFKSKENLLPSQQCPNDTVCCPRRQVSKKKCYEYAKHVFSKEGEVNPLGEISSDESSQDECGIIGIPLIVGGERAVLKEFPHMAAIGFGKSPDRASWQCGGSLISDRFVLTAAHCLLKSVVGKPRFLLFGTVSLVKNDGFTQLRLIQKIIIHPSHQPHMKQNDIALLLMNKPLVFDPYVHPLCLDFKGEILENSALATGWGKTDYDHIKGSEHLMKVKLDLINRNVCHIDFKRKLKSGLDDSKICSGTLTGGKDTCQGDSGGPLQTFTEEPYCMYNLIGLTSFGSMFCGSSRSVAVYTRIWTFLPWIESVVWPGEE